HRLSLASIVLNIGVSVLMASESLIAICAMIVGTLSVVLATPLVAIANGANWMMLHSVDPFAYLGLASIRLPEYSGWAAGIYFLYYLPLTLLTLQLMRWQPLKPPKRAFRTRCWSGLPLMGYGVLSTTILLHPFSTGSTGGRLRIDFLDVGQGDSALLTMPDGTTLLIDGGGRPDFTRTEQRDLFERDTRSIGEAVVSEYLWWRGIDSVDYVLATHADADHIDGLNDVVRNFIVRAALVGRTPSDDPEYAKFSVTTEMQSVPVVVTSSSDTLLFGDVSARVLWPPPMTKQNAPSQNNDSVVLQVRYGNRQMLLTGDIEKGAESSLVRRGADLRSDVVKVAHHGSKTSSIDGFVQATSPKLAIISVGERSIFGHPNREVVTRWQASGAEVLITGKCGTITVSTDGTKLLVETFLNRSGD
ncbi:MAG TPA: ComEC/Rec2 family competence protein, partial [Pyrinomonadaceae bacterium]|nr:ComEC/Rec2 family competence protein [Pyrinomonadaceae bacterium]